MSAPTISILIAAYQAARFLPGALAGVATQTMPSWELIVVEDGSRDETESIVRSFAAEHSSRRVVYENLGVNRGVAGARNRLLELAQGEILAFLDTDDLWDADHLATLAGCLQDGGHALACSSIRLWDGDHHRALGTHAPTAQQLVAPRIELFQSSFIMTSTCVALPRATVKKVGRFDENLRIGEDRDYWFRSLEGGYSLGHTGRLTCRYTKHQASSMAKTLLVAADAVRFYEKHLAASGIPVRLCRSKLADALAVHGRLLRASEPRTAAKLLGRALRLDPWQLRTWLAWAAAEVKA